MKAVTGSSQRTASILSWRPLVHLAALAAILVAVPGFGQQHSVQASIDESCATHEARFVVPTGQVARDFASSDLVAGLSCTTRYRIDDKAWGISSNSLRSGNVYYYNENANGRNYSLVDNKTKDLPLAELVLGAGEYHVHVDGGINANVKVSYRLSPAPGVGAAGFPLGIVWRFGRADGSAIAGRITLQAGGTIQGYHRPNEDHWGLENGKVVFYDASNQAITRFTTSAQEGGGTVLRGAFLPNPAITHVLTEIERVAAPPASGEGSGTWEYVGIGDCPGNDIAGGGAGSVPNRALCDSQHAGLAAVCWDSTTPRVMSSPACTIKSVRAENCTGGVNPGRMYRCVFRPGVPSTVSQPVAPEDHGVRIGPREMDTDRMGADIRGFDLPTADPAACQAECVATRECTAWTYVKPDTKQGPRPRCWLKHSSPGKNPDPSCISGVVERDTPR